MTTLYSSVLVLHALHDGALQPTQGHHALAAFYNLVEQVDPVLSAALHDADARKPFTLSQLNGLPAMRNGEVCLRAGHECWLRVTLAGDVMFETFIRHFMYGPSTSSGQALRPTIRLGEMQFGISAVFTSLGSHPWAGYTTAEELLCAARPDTQIALEFASPFSFSLGDGRFELMPRPELLFGGLARKWAQWCATPLPIALDETWLSRHVLVREWRIESRALRYARQVQVGSIGKLTFELFDADVPTACTLNALADFAFYAGIGRKTTQGMGQVRRMTDSG